MPALLCEFSLHWLPTDCSMVWNTGYLNSSEPYHVWVVPMPWPGVGNDGVLVVSVVVYYACHRLPAVLDVVKVAPNVA